MGAAALLVEFVAVVAVGLKERTRGERFVLPITALVVGTVIAAVRSPYTDEAVDLLRSYLAVILIYYAGVLASDSWVTGLLIGALVVGCLIAMSLILYLWAGDPNPKITILNQWLHSSLRDWLHPALRTRVEPANLNAAGVLVATLLPFPFIALLRGKAAARTFGALATICVLASLLPLSARASWLGAASALVGSALAVGRGIVLAAITVSAGALAALATSSLDWHLGTFLTMSGRLKLWELSIGLLLPTLPFGPGLGAFPHLLETTPTALAEGDIPTTPHNSLIQLAGDAGALGLVAFVVGFVLLVRGLRNIRRGTALRQAAVVALLTYGSIGLFESLVVITQPIRPGVFVSVASPIPWLLLAMAERERIAQERTERSR